ncbi:MULTISPECIES: DUF4397 domain-containing protein [unclassified Paenibacillus]|uniref:DUF4397 domain-containing protein n=1 Tax=unclassified Paenibacillus TaxID=185978 RepID=UPI000956F721|nr:MULTISPECIES: DUF4397 domain-containing protein [unclassified Paenibacillus]ASS67684.1 DUF4397 domain-containing protein [Paenibacillus sp. RUD330]SIR66586.1 protein of unknown function [Paenibacillus sp. RU4X]SIR74487.1 protein of unknown function [Paenibacillus sp. RU4T]
MSNHQPVWEEWQKASLYGMLAGLYEYSEPEWGRYYRQLHSEALSRLAALVRQHGLPFAPVPAHGTPAAAVSGLPGLDGPQAWNPAYPGSANYDAAPGLPGYAGANPYGYPAPHGQQGNAVLPYHAAAPHWSSEEAGFPPPPSLPGFPAPSGFQGLSASAGYPGSYGYPSPSFWPGPAGAASPLPDWTPSAAPQKSAGAAAGGSAHSYGSPTDSPYKPNSGSPVPREPHPGDGEQHAAPELSDSAGLPPAHVRLLHAQTGKEKLDFHLGTTVQPLDYLEASSYLEVRPGRCPLAIQEGPSRSPVASAELDLRSGAWMTAAVAGNGELLLFEDERESSADRARIRLLHLADGRAPADLMIRDGGTLFRRVAYGSPSSYITLSPAELELELCEAGSLRTLLSPQSVTLSPAQAATLLFTGDSGLIVLADGS